MKVLIASMSTLFIEALQAVVRERRSTWQVDIYPLQAPILTQALMKKVKEQNNDIVVIETTNHDCIMIMESLKKSRVWKWTSCSLWILGQEKSTTS